MVKFNKFLSNEEGNVALMFAGTLTLILILTGAAIDYSNASRLQNRLQSQVDAGVLAAATLEISKSDSSNETELRTEAAYKVLEANGYANAEITPTLEIANGTVTLTAELEYSPFFGGFIGQDTMKLSADSESGLAAMSDVEIVLVLDNTRSMSVDGKMDALQTGAKELITAIEGSNSGSKIGLVPFARYVRVPDSAATEGWLDLPNEYDTSRTYQQAHRTGGTCVDVIKTEDRDGEDYTYVTQECTGQTVTYTTETNLLESRWGNCVGTRRTPYSELDGSYSFKVPGLLNKIPYEVSGLTYDRNAYCPAEMVALTDDYDGLRNSINNFWTTDETYIPSGLIWGQRLLSPGLPYDNVDDGSDKRQIMVLMTDGRNTTEITENSTAESELNAPPYVSELDDDVVADIANATTTRMCESIKNEGIEIYTIAFKVGTATKNLLRSCASSTKKAFTADSNDELVAEFNSIADSLRDEVRLMR